MESLTRTRARARSFGASVPCPRGLPLRVRNSQWVGAPLLRAARQLWERSNACPCARAAPVGSVHARSHARMTTALAPYAVGACARFTTARTAYPHAMLLTRARATRWTSRFAFLPHDTPRTTQPRHAGRHAQGVRQCARSRRDCWVLVSRLTRAAHDIASRRRAVDTAALHDVLRLPRRRRPAPRRGRGSLNQKQCTPDAVAGACVWAAGLLRCACLRALSLNHYTF